MKNSDKKFRSAITEAARRQGWRLDHLAEKLGYTPGGLRKALENNTFKPAARKMLLETLGLPLNLGTSEDENRVKVVPIPDEHLNLPDEKIYQQTSSAENNLLYSPVPETRIIPIFSKRVPVFDINNLSADMNSLKPISFLELPELNTEAKSGIPLNVPDMEYQNGYPQGSYIAIAPIGDFADIINGSVYIVKTSNHPVIRRVYKIPDKPDYYLLTADNPEQINGRRIYPDDTIPIKNITYMARVLGWAKYVSCAI